MHEDENKEKRVKLPAERFFDKAVYGGISYFAQAAAGIGLAYWLKHGSGQPYFEKMGKWLGPKLFKNIAENKGVEAAAKEGATVLTVSTMIAVGTAFLIPVKMLEKHKAKIVRGMHERAHEGKDLTPEEKAFHEKCLQDLENEPKQTWGSLLEGRIASLAGVYALMFAIGNKNNQAMQDGATKAIMGGFEKIGATKLAKNQTLSRTINIGFLDVFYSAVSASGLYIYSHWIRPPKKEKLGHTHEPIPVNIVSEITDMSDNTPAPALSFQERVKSREINNKAPEKPEALYTQKIAAEPDTASISPAL